MADVSANVLLAVFSTEYYPTFQGVEQYTEQLGYALGLGIAYQVHRKPRTNEIGRQLAVIHVFRKSSSFKKKKLKRKKIFY